MELQTINKTAIITRYNEYIDWIRYIIDQVDFIYIYNKGPNTNFFKMFDITQNDSSGKPYSEKIKFEILPNIGRIDHTFVHHILEHWDNLPDTLINLPGSIMMCNKKGYYLSSIFKKIGQIRSKYSGFFGPRFHKISPHFNYNIDNYSAESVCNQNSNPFIKSEFKDFQVWKKAIIDDRPMRYVAMRGMFTVCKENILHIDKSIYERLKDSLSVGDNIENGHFAERIWAHLFRQYSFDTKQKIEAEPEIEAEPITGVNFQ
jgi:hypothetical protein